MIRANFKIAKSKFDVDTKKEDEIKPRTDLTKKEFEEYMMKTGAAGSFMVFRSDKKDDEMGLDEL